MQVFLKNLIQLQKRVRIYYVKIIATQGVLH